MVDIFITILIIYIVEVLFSLENIIINFGLLQKISTQYRRYFIYIGSLIAIFGVRIVFPTLIVTFTSDNTFSESISLIFNNPDKFKHILDKDELYISLSSFYFLFTFLSNELIKFSIVRNFFSRRFDFLLRSVSISITTLMRIIYILITVMTYLFVVTYYNYHNLIPITLISAISIIAYYLCFVYSERIEKRLSFSNSQSNLFKLIIIEFLDMFASIDSTITSINITHNLLFIFIGTTFGVITVRCLTIYMFKHFDKVKKYIDTIEFVAYINIFFLVIIIYVSLFTAVKPIFILLTTISIVSIVGYLTNKGRSNGIVIK